MRKRPKRKVRIPFKTICFVLVITYIATLLLWPMQSISATKKTIKIDTGTTPVLEFPAYGQTALGTEAGEVLATYGDQQQPMPIASITKIITALVVLEKKPLHAGQTGPTITFTQEDAALYNKYFLMQGSIVRSDAGMQLSQYEVMQAMLVISANNYADTLAVWAYGSMGAYLQAAKEYLAKHNLKNTVVADASGFSPQSASNTTDLVKLGSLALKNTVVADIVSQPSATINGIGTLQNTNLLVGDDGFIGIKTGTTDEAGSCLLYAARRTVGDSSITVIGATLGAPTHSVLARNVYTLVEQAYDSFKEVTLANKGQPFATYSTEWQGDIHAVATKKSAAIIWPGQAITANIATNKLQPSKNESSSAGSVTFTIGSARHTTDLVLEKSLQHPSWLWKLTHPTSVVKKS